MSKSSIAQSFAQAASQQNLAKALALPRKKVRLEGLVGSALSFVISNAFKDAERPFLLIFNDKEEAAYYLNDLEQLVGEKNVLFYPGSYRRPYQIEETDNANVLLRAEVLNRINSRKKSALIVTYPDALFEKVVTRKELEKNTLKISLNDELSIDFVNEVLFEYKFRRVDFVTEPGEFSVRGGIVDVFSFSNDEPYRIEFFGDDVESIRTFDVETQLSTDKVKKISIIPNVEHKRTEEIRESFLKYISDKTVIFTRDVELLSARFDKLFSKAIEAFKTLSEEVKHGTPEELFCSSSLLKEQMQEYSLVEMYDLPRKKNAAEEVEKIQFRTKPQPSFNKQFDLLIQDLRENHEKGFSNYIFCVSDQQAKRFHDIFDDVGEEVHYKTLVLSHVPGIY